MPFAAVMEASKFWQHFILAWAVMFMSYCLRKPFGLLKINLKEDLGLSEVGLGMMGKQRSSSVFKFQFLVLAMSPHRYQSTFALLSYPDLRSTSVQQNRLCQTDVFVTVCHVISHFGIQLCWRESAAVSVPGCFRGCSGSSVASSRKDGHAIY